VVAYNEGEVGESMMSSFYTKARARSSREAPFVARVKGLYNAMTGSASSKMIWIGWAGLNDASPSEEVALRAELESRDCVPVMMRAASCGPYFDGMCNDVLWPLLHCCEPGLGDRSSFPSFFFSCGAQSFVQVLTRARGAVESLC